MSGWKLFPVFVIVMFVLLFFVQFFFYSKVSHYLKAAKKPSWMKTATVTLFALFNVPLIVLLIWRPHFTYFPDWFLYIGVYPFYVWHFSLLIILLIYLLLKIVQSPFLLLSFIIKAIRSKNNTDQTVQHQIIESQFSGSRRALLRNGFSVLAGATFLSSGYGAIKRNNYEVSAVEIPIRNLPESFQGFTIALASDIHSSVFMEKEMMQKYADVINNMNADLIALPGDFVNSTLDEVYPCAEAFSSLKAPHGIYGVLGNHDYFTRQVEKVAQEINACGIKLLRNERLTLTKNGQSLHLLGINDTGNKNVAASYVDEAIHGITDTAPKILLSHRPYFFKSFAVKNIDLTLSGHTHGGQVVFLKLGENTIAPARMVSPYVAGVYTSGLSSMYVSRGLGTVGIPIRLNCPPELTKITLVRE